MSETDSYTGAVVEQEIVDQDKSTEKIVSDFLEKELPPSESRIKIPMHPECKVCVVIPAYAEREDLFSRTLSSLSQQEQVTLDDFEVLVVVNNGEDSPDQIKKENEDILGMLCYLQGGNTSELPGDITDAELVTLEQIRGSEVKIYAIDKSTNGNVLK